MSFGSELKKLRLGKHLGVNQLALNSGVSASQISRFENGKKVNPKPSTLSKLAKGLKVPEKELYKIAGLEIADNPSDDLSAPEWATQDDRIDLAKLLESSTPMGYDEISWDEDDKKKVQKVIEGIYWDRLKEMREKGQK